MADLDQRLRAATEKLCKWRSVFAGWQLGTRPKDDPECQAVRDHREMTILLRAEVTALLGLLLKKGVVTIEDFQAQMLEEIEYLDRAYERKFPGIRAYEHGITIDLAEVERHGTLKNWRP